MWFRFLSRCRVEGITFAGRKHGNGSMRRISLRMMSVLAVCAFAVPVSAQQDVVDADAAGRPATDSAGYYKASDMIGMPVHGSENQEIGKVQDLLVDGSTNQIEFLILDTTSVVDLGGQYPIVPWTIVHTHYTDNTVMINVPVTVERIRTAPMITVADLDLRGTPAWRTEVNQFYSTEIEERRVARPDLDRNRDDANRDDAGRPNRNADRDQPDRPRQGDRPRAGEKKDRPDAANRPDAGNRPGANRPNSPKPEARTTDKPAPKADAPKADTPPQPKTDEPKADAAKPDAEKKPATP